MKILILLFLVSCASIGTNELNQLRPNMTIDEVTDLMGEPEQTQFKNGHLIYKYTMWEAWKGNFPYYLSFRMGKLKSWNMDAKERARNQEALYQFGESMRKHNEANQAPEPQIETPTQTNCTSIDLGGGVTSYECESY